MKRKEIAYLGGIVFIILVLFIVRTEDRPLNWAKTFSRYDTNPYGSYALGELLQDIVPGQQVSTSNKTLYEISEEDSLANFLVITENFLLDDESLTNLFNHVSDGKAALISSMYYAASFLDTLGITTNYQETAFSEYMDAKDSTRITLKDSLSFEYLAIELGEYFDELPDGYKILGINENQHPIALKVPFGDGYFILNTTPIVFTNYFMLFESNSEVAAQLLSHLPVNDIHWTDYYQVGRLQSNSPFRALLEYPSMRTALYLTLVLILLSLLFQSKRRQRLIPIVQALPNYTLQFIKTIGTLYYQSGDHKAMIMNRISYFKEYLGTSLGIRWTKDGTVVQSIVAKTGLEHSFVEKLCDHVRRMEANPRVSQHDVFELNRRLEIFYQKRTQKLSNI